MATLLKDADYNKLVVENEKPVMIDFWATWCGPCRAIAPVVEELSKEYEGKVDIFKCDVDENAETVAKYGVRNIPTLVFLKKGELKDKLVGAASKNAIAEKLDNLMK